MSATPNNPFEQLGIAPTVERVRIKRAYFDAITRSPPHRDPEAFARVRAAYEALMRPGGPEAALLELPPDPEADGAPYRERYAARLEEARVRVRMEAAAKTAVADFVELARGSTLEGMLGELRRRG